MGIPTGGNLIVPVVLWGKNAPSHTISALALSFDQRTILTGSSEGQICLWECDPATDKITPKFFLYGHVGSITCIEPCSEERPYFVSASISGELCLWDVKDGRCIESSKCGHIHTAMQSYKFEGHKSLSLICNGHYPEIYVINPDTLEVIYSLVARVHPDWLNAVCVIKPIKRNDDIILAITKSGTIKMWSMDIHTVKSLHIYEDESKQIRCTDAQVIRCCPQNQRTVLIVCSKYWQIYDAGEFSLLCSELCGNGNQWCGGEFIALDKVIVWNNNGQAFLYKLPSNKLSKTKPTRPPRPGQTSSANPETSDYHHMVGSKAIQCAAPSLYCVIDTKATKFMEDKSLFICEKRHTDDRYLVLRADADGCLVWWCIKSLPLRHSTDGHIPTIYSSGSMSVVDLWRQCQPVGLLDNVSSYLGCDCEVTTSIFIEQSIRLICGLSDGQIIIIPVISTIRSLFLQQSKDSKATFPLHKMLVGHKARVNCLLHPHSLESRYSPNHLLSGSSDFTINLWDLSLGQLLHSFNIHAGEISHLYIPPSNCNTRILSCVCSVASDHSVALLSLKEKRCLLFASRHMFPVVTIKWRPVEDFMMISCSDSTAYVWQMETGLLDRVVHGVTAVEMLKACDEAAQKVSLQTNQTNPQISIAQAMKRRNLATFRNFAQQAIQNLENLVEEDDITSETESSLISVHNQPLIVQGLRSNTTDREAHIIMFDTEALVVLILCEEFGIPSSEYINNSSSLKTKGEVEKKLTDWISVVKEKAEGLGQLARNETMGLSNDIRSSSNGSRSSSPLSHRRRGSSDSLSSKDSDKADRSDTVALEITQTFLSLLHAWSLNPDLDKVCLKKLGLERLVRSVCYGLLSQSGQMVLMLPTPQSSNAATTTAAATSTVEVDSTGSLETSYCKFWEVSPALTTQHLLSVISLAHTLMSVANPSFIRQKSSNRKQQHPQSSLSGMSNGDGGHSDSAADLQVRQSQSKQAWSQLATLHCVLLPELVSSQSYQSPQLHLLANRWQDRCLEVREAAQALLLAELKRIGSEGRHQVMMEWSPFMPDLKDDCNGIITMAEPENYAPMLEEDRSHINKINNERRRLEATAIVMLGVIGSEFGKDIEPNKRSSKLKKLTKRVSLEGFSIGDHGMALHTSKALAFLLLNPQQCKLPQHAPLRRAVIDLLGRGFSVWQPYIDVSAVLLGLLEICINAEKHIPSVQSGLPLSPEADACRTARHALTLIASAKPATFLTCMAKEVARFNAVAQNPHSGTTQSTTVLIKAKPEILRVIELLIDKQPNDVADLLIETMDVAVHCLDPNSIKARGLQETFPALCRFAMVSYCTSSRRICVGSKNGSLAFYELKQSKAQSIPFQASPTSAMILYLKASSKETISAHKGAVAAVSFAEDGKYLASYSPVDAKVHFWQTASTSLFGIGSAHTKCIKSYNVPFKNPGPPQPNVTRGGRLAWIDTRTIALVLPDGSESRYRV